MPDIYSAEFWEDVEERALLRLGQYVRHLRDRIAVGGRIYGQTVLEPQMRVAKALTALPEDEEM